MVMFLQKYQIFFAEKSCKYLKIENGIWIDERSHLSDYFVS